MKISRLEQIREELGLNKTQFAEAMGISSHYYYHILAGKGTSNLRLEHLESLLIRLGINPVWIITGEGEKYIKEGREITPEMLLASITEHLPEGWEKQWYAQIFPQVCQKAVDQNEHATFQQLQLTALQACLVLITQLTTLINKSKDSGYSVTLNYDGQSYTFPSKPSE